MYIPMEGFLGLAIGFTFALLVILLAMFSN